MRPEVIGVTTDKERIAKMLGVQDESEYGFYQETDMGKYYARFLEDGTFEPKVVRLISTETAAVLEGNACDAIEKTGEQIKKSISAAPVFNKEKFDARIAEINRQTKERAEQMGKNIKESLEKAGFHPTFSHN